MKKGKRYFSRREFIKKNSLAGLSAVFTLGAASSLYVTGFLTRYCL